MREFLFFFFLRIIFEIFDVADRYRKMICTGWWMTRESCIKVEFICKQSGRWQIDADAGEGTEGNGVVGCVLTKLARNYFQPGTSVATGKIGFYAFIARTVCAGKISLEFAQEFSSTSVANSSRETSGKKVYLIIRIKSHTFRALLDTFLDRTAILYKVRKDISLTCTKCSTRLRT